MEEEKHVFGPFQPDLPAHTNGNGSGSRRRALRVMPGVIFGVLLGALLATYLVSRVQWLNLARVGWWGRPVIAASAAGAIVGAFRRDDRRAALIGGGLAALLSLWGVYGIVRFSIPVMFVERSVARVVAADLARLSAYAIPAGVVGAAAAWFAGSAITAPRDRR